MRDSYSFQIPRHPPINRKRKPFGYVNELSEADSQHWSLRNNIERALPDCYPGVVVWIGLIAIQKFGDQRWTEDDDGYQSCQARSQPDLARNTAASPDTGHHDKGNTWQHRASRACANDAKEHKAGCPSGCYPP